MNDFISDVKALTGIDFSAKEHGNGRYTIYIPERYIPVLPDTRFTIPPAQPKAADKYRVEPVTFLLEVNTFLPYEQRVTLAVKTISERYEAHKQHAEREHFEGKP